MALIEMAIVVACAGAPSQYGQACNKAADAGTRQVGIKQKVDKVEEISTKLVDKEAKTLLGEKGVSVVGTGMFLYKANLDKKVTLTVPTLGLCNSASTEIGQDNYGVKLLWNLP